MGWGDKEAILAQNAGMVREIELLREMLEDKKSDIEELRTQLKRTQEALVAKEAPEAYRDQREATEKADREPTPEEAESLDKMRREAENLKGYIDGLEGPLFVDAEDMIDMLTPKTTPESKSLHGDSES